MNPDSIGICYIIGRVFGDDGKGSNTSRVNQAVLWAISKGATIISMSLGGTGSDTTSQNVFDTAYSKGVLSIAAAGNNGSNGNAINYPAGYANVLSVAAVDSSR
jgi:serine protease